MATTTNYGFTVPTSADLVKNGATAISTLGQNLDTFLFRPLAVNPVINSAMQVWQRGTSMAGSGTAYCADRWQAFRAVAGSTYSRQATGDTTNLPNIQYCLRMSRDSGNTATNAIFASQGFETINSIPYAGKTVTLSLYARKGANFSATSNLLNVQVITGTGTDQNWISGYTGQAVPIDSTATLTTTWQRFTYTGTIASTATELSISLNFAPTGTAGAADYAEITGIQLEAGSQATPFRTAGNTYQQELAACQRYFNRVVDGSLNAYSGFNVATVASSTRADTVNTIPINLRGTPTIKYRAVGDFVAGGQTVTAINSYSSSGKYTNINFSVASGLTTGQCVRVELNNAATGYLDYDSEL